MFNPIDGLPEIDKADIRPGDEVVWAWNAGQGLDWVYYVHTTLPRIEGDEKARQKAEREFKFVIERDRTFYLVKRG